jgi:hypothetical protein
MKIFKLLNSPQLRQHEKMANIKQRTSTLKAIFFYAYFLVGVDYK